MLAAISAPPAPPVEANADCAVLRSLYATTGGSTWHYAHEWTSDTTSASACCVQPCEFWPCSTWWGVECDAAGRVKGSSTTR